MLSLDSRRGSLKVDEEALLGWWTGWGLLFRQNERNGERGKKKTTGAPSLSGPRSRSGGLGKRTKQKVRAGSLPLGSLDIVKAPLQRVLVGVGCLSPPAPQ